MDVHIGIEHRKRSQLHGWTVAAQEAAKKEKDEKETEVEQGGTKGVECKRRGLCTSGGFVLVLSKGVAEARKLP